MNALFKIAISLALALVISLSAGSGARADRRVALVIGNARYPHAGVLPKVVSDANAVADLLEKAGFDVVNRRSDLGIHEFKQAVSDFALLYESPDYSCDTEGRKQRLGITHGNCPESCEAPRKEADDVWHGPGDLPKRSLTSTTRH